MRTDRPIEDPVAESEIETERERQNYRRFETCQRSTYHKSEPLLRPQQT